MKYVKNVVIVVAVFLAGVLAGPVFKPTLSDQPSYTPVELEKVPSELMRNISAAFPQAKLDAAAQISSMAGPGYRVVFHDTRGYYCIDVIGLPELESSQPPVRINDEIQIPKRG